MQAAERDLRTFPQVWESLDEVKREELRHRIIADGYTLSRQTIYNWASGKFAPSNIAIKNGVAGAVKKVTGLCVYGLTLFPAKTITRKRARV